nr:MAG TPA: hypothetical protein [Caudoviricetes sp.]
MAVESRFREDLVSRYLQQVVILLTLATLPAQKTFPA